MSKRIIIAAALAAASTYAVAQTSTAPNTAPMNDRTTAPNATQTAPMNSNTANPKPPAAGPKFITQKDTGMLSSNVEGLDVYNGSNENVGKIKDVSMENGTVDGYVLSVGGFLGMGTRYVIVSPPSLNIAYRENEKKWYATVNASKDEMKNAPEFKYNGKWNASQN